MIIMSGRMFTYPIYGELSKENIDEIIHYDAYKKFMELLAENLKLSVLYSNLGEGDIQKIKEIVPYAELVNIEDYLEDMNSLIEDLFHNGKIEVGKKIDYYCKKCNRYYSQNDVVWKEESEVKDILKVRIGRRLYFVSSIIKGIEPVGIALSDSETYLAVKVDKDIWISPESMLDVLVNDIELPEESIAQVKIGDIKKKAKLVGYVVTGDVKTGFITKEDVDLYDLKRRISSYAVIYSVQEKIKNPVCPVCGERVERMETPILMVDVGKNKIRISSPEGSYKIPVLYCDSCGNFEYGIKVRECPVCGNIMETKFHYDPRILSLGAYYSGINEKTDFMYIHQKNGAKRIIKKIMGELKEDMFGADIILTHETGKDEDLEYLRANYLLKSRGKNNDSPHLKLKKIKQFIENIINYSQIYGRGDPRDKIDEWLLFRNEKIKERYISCLKRSKFACGFEILYNFVVGDISRFYIPAKRNEPIVFAPMVDIIKMLYPYAPEFSLEMLKKLEIEGLNLLVSEVKEVPSVDSIREIIREIMRFREKNKIPRREPLKKVVFVSEQADELKDFTPTIMKYVNILVLNITDKWGEMELDVEPDIQAIGQMYRAWAPKIAFLLKRKNVKDILSALNKGGYTMGIEGFIVKITPNMVKIVEKVPRGYIKLNSKIGSLYVNSERDSSTTRIRLVNEIIRRVNYMRRDLEVEYDDVIDISIHSDEGLLRILKSYMDEIRDRTRARNVDFRYIEYAYVVEWPISGYDVVISINPLFKKWVIKAFESIPGIAENKAEMLFHMGYGSIYELMQASPGELAEIPGFSVASANKLRDYLYKKAFKPKKSGNKEYCPFCGAELTKEDDFCPRCGAPIRVKIEKKGIEEGNVYMNVGDLTKVIPRIPPQLMEEKKLLITKEEPEEAKKIYNLKNTHLIWISYVPIGKSIKPKNLEKLRDEIEKFLGKGGKVILMDCFDFMTAINGFDNMLNFLKDLREDIKSVRAYLFFNVEELEEEKAEQIAQYVDGEI